MAALVMCGWRSATACARWACRAASASHSTRATALCWSAPGRGRREGRPGVSSEGGRLMG